MSRYVVLHHECLPDYVRATHWDLMLEEAGRLRTWALLGEPAGGRALEAEPLGDHRLVYLDYEGPVSGDRGRVTRWDGGMYVIQQESPEQLLLRLDGERLKGQAELVRSSAGTGLWQFIYLPDD